MQETAGNVIWTTGEYYHGDGEEGEGGWGTNALLTSKTPFNRIGSEWTEAGEITVDTLEGPSAKVTQRDLDKVLKVQGLEARYTVTRTYKDGDRTYPSKFKVELRKRGSK